MQGASLLRRVLPFLSVAVLAAALYDGWIFYSRWRSVRDAERARRDAETERARQTIEMLGGDSFRIMNFYAVPSTIRRGQTARFCYGVFGAKSVRIEPQVEELKPAITDCFDVKPRKTAQYKLIAEDGAGHTVSQSLVVHVH